MIRSQDYVAKLERAIEQKFGKKAITNPRSLWSEEKEEKYQEERKELKVRDTARKDEVEKIEHNGFLISKNLINKEEDKNRHCFNCNSFIFSGKDELYIIKYDCCYHCYQKWVYGNEEKWKSGWRPGEKING